MDSAAYIYRNLPIGGGGYVTGFIFHPKEKGLLYARTDIGGVYRFDAAAQQWVSLVTHVTPLELSQAFPISVALDPDKPSRLLIACGERHRETGKLAISEDYGGSFRSLDMPAYIHGNLNGRGTGERLIIDRGDADTLFFASQTQGLFVSHDLGESWTRIEAMPEQTLTFAAQPAPGVLLIGSAGVTTGEGGRTRGPGLYVSYDGGGSFEAVPHPCDPRRDCPALTGLVAQRCAADGQYVYVTFAATGRGSYTQELGYSCDSGDSECGSIVRYPLLEDGRLGAMEEITPPLDGEYGFSGISVCPQMPGRLLASTICREEGDCVCLSEDCGRTWRVILCDLDVGRMDFRMPYMRPCCNGGHNIIHWLSDIAIDPFDPRCAWFNTGTGVFRTQNLGDEETVFSDWCDAMEETVHLNVYAPPGGRNQVIDIVGDLGGFAFAALDQPCSNSFADDDGNRYITCMNADYRDENPDHVIVTPRGNWKGKTKGGLIVSMDGCESFKRLPMPWGLSGRLDALLARIEQPNVNAGWAALGADGRTIVWAVGEGDNLPADCALISHDGGASFSSCAVVNAQGEAVKGGLMKPFADRCDPDLFFGFGEAGQLYVSRDGGRTFAQKAAPRGFPKVNMGQIDCRNRTEIRVESGRRGVIYLALGNEGLWKLGYDAQKDVFTGRRLSAPGDAVFRVGLGLGRPGGDYFAQDKMLYLSGVLGGEYGFYRTGDDMAHVTRLNTHKQMFGEINSIDGDSRRFGVFYLATGTYGLLYGRPQESE